MKCTKMETTGKAPEVLKKVFSFALVLLFMWGTIGNANAQKKSTTTQTKTPTATAPAKVQSAKTQTTAARPKTQAAATSQAKAMTPNSFAGKTFNVVMAEQGKTEPQKDQLVFDRMNFEATGSRKNGFVKSPYKYTYNAGTGTFESTSNSPKEGKMVWKGTLKEGRISGTALWTKEGQKDISYSFSGTLAPTATAKAATAK